MLENACFIFTSDKTLYGINAFEELLKGEELKKNGKARIRYGDILYYDDPFDLEPFVIRNSNCTIKKSYICNDYPFCIIIEGIKKNIMDSLSKRLINYDGYIGCTNICYYSRDVRKIFWRKLPSDILLDNNNLYFKGTKDDSNDILEKFKKFGYKINYEAFDINFYSELIDDETKKKIKYMEKKIPNGVDFVRSIGELGFNLNMEVRLSTALIWESVEKLAKIYFCNAEEPYLAENAYFCLYNASQGIERLQKVLIELILRDNNNFIDYEEDVYNLLRSHDHSNLKKYIDIHYPLNEDNDKKISKLTQVLSNFYNNIRYNNYSNINAKPRCEFYNLLKSFGSGDAESNDFDLSVKNTFGKFLGLYSRFLYKKISEISCSIPIFTYELEGDSYGLHVIYCEEENLYREYMNMQISKKELIYKLIKDGPQNIKKLELEPLDIPEENMLNNYIPDLINNYIIKIHDEVDYHYSELSTTNHEEFSKRFNIMKYLFNGLDFLMMNDDNDEIDL